VYRQERLDRLRELLSGAQIEALYVTAPENRYYISGFTGSDGSLLICREQVALFTDFRYMEQARQECPGCKVIEVQSSYEDILAAYLREKKYTNLGLDGDHLHYNQYQILRDSLAGVEIKEAGGLVENLRITKDGEELLCMTEAARIADVAFAKVLPGIVPGVTERQIALQLEYAMKNMGAEGVAFSIIVASGVRGALPHGVASDKQLEKQDMVTIDFGAVFQGYHSDITRTVVLGEPNSKQEEIYNICLEAQTKAIKAVRSGIVASEVDKVARDIITDKGYGDCFGHGTGHGLGLNIHEKPKLSQRDDTILRQGMTVTVEPGIYLPDWGGVRIEDTVVVEENGCKILTGTEKMSLRNVLK